MQTRCNELQGDLDACLDTLETDRTALTESQRTIHSLQVLDNKAPWSESDGSVLLRRQPQAPALAQGCAGVQLSGPQTVCFCMLTIRCLTLHASL